MSLIGLAGLVAYDGLRLAGFQFVWEVEDPNGPPRRPASRSSDRTTTSTPDPSATASREHDAAVGAAGGSRTAPGPPAVGWPAADTGHARPPRPDPSRSTPVEARSDGGAASAPRAPGRGEFASIDFETLPDGRPVCTNCPAAGQWRTAGVVFSFHSWTADATEPYVLDARNFLPDGVARHALGPPLSGERGLEVGVTRLDFPGRPRKVAFTLYGPDLIRSFAVTAWSDGTELPASAQVRSLERKYNPAGRGRFRAERILVEAPGGVDRISLDGWGPPGHVLLVDNLAIDP